MNEQAMIEAVQRTYWDALDVLDEAVAERWYNALHALREPKATAAPRRLLRLLPALQAWQTWARTIGSECVTHPERATVGVHHLYIACHPLVMVHALHAHPYVARGWGETTGNRFFSLAQSITEKCGDLGDSSVRGEAAGRRALSDDEWGRYWQDADRKVARLSLFITELIGAPPGGDHA